MDKLYIGDIPQQYHYARFSSNYIDLYNTDTLQANNTYTYYRIYLYDNLFMYDTFQTNTGGYYQNQYCTNISVTDNVLYRRDMPFITLWCFILVIGFVLLINIVTSFIKKGGVLGGLL